MTTGAEEECAGRSRAIRLRERGSDLKDGVEDGSDPCFCLDTVHARPRLESVSQLCLQGCSGAGIGASSQGASRAGRSGIDGQSQGSGEGGWTGFLCKPALTENGNHYEYVLVTDCGSSSCIFIYLVCNHTSVVDDPLVCQGRDFSCCY